MVVDEKDEMSRLPIPTEGGSEVAKMTTGVAAAVAALWFPPAALAAPVVYFAIEKFIERPKRLLLDELRHGNIEILSTEDAAEFVPMAYKFLEAAKEGEYEHNLKILAAYIANELRTGAPRAMNVKRAATRIEGIEESDLQVIALIKQVRIDDEKHVFDSDIGLKFVSASLLAANRKSFHKLSETEIKASLANLSSRGFLLADGASRLDKDEEYYDVQPCLLDLIHKASSTLEPT